MTRATLCCLRICSADLPSFAVKVSYPAKCRVSTMASNKASSSSTTRIGSVGLDIFISQYDRFAVSINLITVVQCVQSITLQLHHQGQSLLLAYQTPHKTLRSGQSYRRRFA